MAADGGRDLNYLNCSTQFHRPDQAPKLHSGAFIIVFAAAEKAPVQAAVLGVFDVRLMPFVQAWTAVPGSRPPPIQISMSASI
jgi:hypothetical protein